MKTKKSGFSMAELIVTLAIIGVTAALILPSLRAKVDSKTYQPKAERIAGNIQNAVMNVMSAAQSGAVKASFSGVPEVLTDITGEDLKNTIYEKGLRAAAKNDKDSSDMLDKMSNDISRSTNSARKPMNFFRAISGTMGLRYKDVLELEGETSEYGEAIKNTNVFGDSSVAGLFTSKRNGALVIIEQSDSDYNGNDRNIALVRIMIDSNGEKGPNSVYDSENNPNGDIFVYALGNNGNMYPMGTAAYDNHVW